VIVPIALASGLWAGVLLFTVLAWREEQQQIQDRLHRLVGPQEDEQQVSRLRRLSLRVGVAFRRLIPQRLLLLVRRGMQAAGLRTSVEHFIGLWTLLIAAWYLTLSTVALFIELPVWLSALLLGLALIAPLFHLQARAEERTRIMKRSMPFLVDFVTTAVEAGLSLESGLVRASQKLRGPLGDEARRYVQNVNRGMSRRDALLAFADGVGLAEAREFVEALNQTGSYGLPLGTVLRRQAEQIRENRRFAAEEAAQKLPVKLLIPLVLFIFPTIFLFVLGPAMLWLMEHGL
jgi:tight adherence protein C